MASNASPTSMDSADSADDSATTGNQVTTAPEMSSAAINQAQDAVGSISEAATALSVPLSATDGSSGNVGLLTLPPELFERISEFLPAEDLPLLRLSCREGAVKVERTYIKAHFTERVFLLCSKASLQTAIKIAKHERFGAALRGLYISVDRIEENPVNIAVPYALGPYGRTEHRLASVWIDQSRVDLAWQQQDMRSR